MTTKKPKCNTIKVLEEDKSDEIIDQLDRFYWKKELGYVEGLAHGREEGREEGIAMERSRIREVEWRRLATLMAGISFVMTLAAIVAAYFLFKVI